MKPAESLLGITLEGGWKVVEQITRGVDATGGNFSFGYKVEDTKGNLAFLKALDLSRALQAEDLTMALQALTQAYNFERDLLKKCRERGLDRIATTIGEGNYRFPNGGPADVVPYLIFELAEGDARTQIDFSQRFDLGLRLRALHHIATGLWQLHKQEIAHQDLKPSNVLVFENHVSKLADLGRAAQSGATPPHEIYLIQGDPRYAPPELMYGQASENWCVRRQGCDLYLLGSMVVYFFAGTAMTPELLRNLPQRFWPGRWQGTYVEVLPMVRKAFGDAVEGIKRVVEPDYREKIGDLIIQLCDPDVARRGHPRTRGNQALQYSMERYVSIFNEMAFRAEVSFRKKA